MANILLNNIININNGLKIVSSSISENTELTSSSYVITRVQTNSGAYTITLPDADSVTNHYYIICDEDGNANNNNITITTNGELLILL